jgi:hypothetical protein
MTIVQRRPRVVALIVQRVLSGPDHRRRETVSVHNDKAGSLSHWPELDAAGTHSLPGDRNTGSPGHTIVFRGDPYNATDPFLNSAGRKEMLLTKILDPTPDLEAGSKLVMFDIVLYKG